VIRGRPFTLLARLTRDSILPRRQGGARKPETQEVVEMAKKARTNQAIFSSEEKSAGYYDLSIPTSSFSAGTYFLRLEAGAKAKTEKIILR